LRLRSELLAVAQRLIKDRQYTQWNAAVIFDVNQPRISNLMRGRIELFSIDALIEMLSHAGVRVELQITHVRRQRKRVSPNSPAHQTPSHPPAP
jgi:predicted XRE-type DNA-binding protein